MKQNKRTLNPTLKVVLDIGPLLLFFLANARPCLFLPLLRPLLPVAAASGERTGIFVATAVFMRWSMLCSQRSAFFYVAAIHMLLPTGEHHSR